MLTNAFIGKSRQPTDQELTVELGASRPLWDKALAALATEFDLTISEWNSYSPKAGWSLRLKQGKRTILYLIPCRGAFRVAFVLGDKAVEAARQSKLPKQILHALDEAKRYAEGTGLRIEVKSPRDIPAIQKLTALKLAT